MLHKKIYKKRRNSVTKQVLSKGLIFSFYGPFPKSIYSQKLVGPKIFFGEGTGPKASWKILHCQNAFEAKSVLVQVQQEVFYALRCTGTKNTSLPLLFSKRNFLFPFHFLFTPLPQNPFWAILFLWVIPISGQELLRCLIYPKIGRSSYE